jgi:hypothetical protein
LTVEQNIVKNALAFQTNDTFPFLDEIAETKSVIILGEETHQDISTSETKVNMINYLKKKGYHSVALEMVPFLTSYVFSNPEYKDITKNWNVKFIFPPLWFWQESCKPLFDMIINQDIRLWGMDIHLGVYDIESAKAILAKYADKEDIDLDWWTLTNLYLRKFVYIGNPNNKATSVSEQFKLMRMIDKLADYVQYLIYKQGSTDDLKAIMQWIQILNTAFSFVDRETPTQENETALINTLMYRNRDKQMAENILWITENFPDQKFTVWCANFHAMKDISQTHNPIDSLRYFTFQSMGEGIYNKLGNKLYSLAITSLNNEEVDRYNGEKGHLEQEIEKAIHGKPFAYINFEPLRFESGYRDKSFNCTIHTEKGKWLYIFDGLYYIRDQSNGTVIRDQSNNIIEIRK